MQLTTFITKILDTMRLHEQPPTPNGLPLVRPEFADLMQQPVTALPTVLQNSALAQKYLTLLKPIRWERFPKRLENRAWPGMPPRSCVPYVIALLMRLDQGHTSMGQLVEFLQQHPELVWLAGFPLVPDEESVWGFDVVASVPTAMQFSQVIRRLPNVWLQFALDETVAHCRTLLGNPDSFGDCVSFDTKHILAWVKENNPKAYIANGRFHKENQPAGDRDCRVGCKRRRNRGESANDDTGQTPSAEGKSVTGIGAGVGEFYWGYASGVTVTKLGGIGELILAELTQTFDQSDVSYFAPLMAQTERRLGSKPRFGTADAAFDAFYIYEYFHTAGGMAAIPFVERGSIGIRSFAPDGTPLCKAGLPMFLRGTFINRSAFIEHECQRWACPLLHPEPTAAECPIHLAKWDEGGCKSTMASSIGARLRHQIDREGAAYRSFYQQRTAVERIFSQAVQLGIERPKLRNRQSITNLNTLIYVLINLRLLERLPLRLAQA